MSEARSLAQRTGRTLTRVIEDSLRETLGRRSAAPATPVRLVTFAGGGLLPGIDLDDAASLLDALDARS